MILILISVWNARQRLFSSAPPTPPAVITSGLDRAVAELIERTRFAVQAAPRSGAAWGEFGEVLQTYSFRTEALSCFGHAAGLSPREPRWPWFQALLLPHDSGLANLRRAVELCHDDPDLPRVRLAEILFERGAREEAERHFQILLQRHPDHPLALLGLARINIDRDRMADGLSYLNRCSMNAHSARRAHALLAIVQMRLGNVGLAEAACRTGKSLPEDEPWPDPYSKETIQFLTGKNAWLDHAQHLMRQGRLADAQPLIERTVKQYPDAPEGWLFLGRLHLVRKNYSDAERALVQSFRLSPDCVDTHAQLGLVLLQQQRNDEAAGAFERAVQLKPDFAEAHYNLALARSRDGKRAEAIQSYREAIRCKPDAVEPYLALADMLDRSGQKAEAGQLLRQALELNPADRRLMQMLQRLQ